MSQKLKEWAFKKNPIDEHLSVDPDYLKWAEEYDNDTFNIRTTEDAVRSEKDSLEDWSKDKRPF